MNEEITEDINIDDESKLANIITIKTKRYGRPLRYYREDIVSPNLIKLNKSINEVLFDFKVLKLIKEAQKWMNMT